MRQRTYANPIVKDEVTFVRYADETNGSVTEIECVLMPGGGNPPHYHRSYTEVFTVLEGELGLQCGKRTFVLHAGESATVPIDTVHRFFNRSSAPVRFHTLVEPGQPGFENTLRIAYGLARDGQCRRNGVPRSLTHLALHMLMSDTRLPGPMRILEPLMQWLSSRACRRGVDKALIQSYCRA